MLVNVFFLIPRRSVIKNSEFTPSRSTTREVKMTFWVLADRLISKSAVDLGKQGPPTAAATSNFRHQQAPSPFQLRSFSTPYVLFKPQA